jgi:hypothetical protein
MNPLVRQLVESAVVPVPATVPRKSLRQRIQDRRRVAGAAKAMTEDVDTETETNLAQVIPADAVRTSSTGVPLAGEKPLVKAPNEPTNPYAEQSVEELMTPAVALVAPDVTPRAFSPLDLSLLPGYSEVKFTTREADAAKPPANALNVILGRPTAPAAAAAPSAPAPPPALVAAESLAQSMVASMTAQDKVAAALTAAAPATPDGCTMPEHKPSDGRSIMEAFRRYGGPQGN